MEWGSADGASLKAVPLPGAPALTLTGPAAASTRYLRLRPNPRRISRTVFGFAIS
jgi:hypothetical protein